MLLKLGTQGGIRNYIVGAHWGIWYLEANHCMFNIFIIADVSGKFKIH